MIKLKTPISEKDIRNLKVGDIAVVIGSPDDKGEIQAKLVRIFSGENMEALPAFPPPLPPLQ